jgi:DNA-binding NarL/FixJ family response regulator
MGSAVSDCVRVLVADAPLTRLGVRLALEGHAVICAEVDNCALAIQAACSQRPDVCLIGHSLPGGAITAIRAIASAVPQTSVVVLSDRDDTSGLVLAVRAGAVGFVPARCDAEQLRRVISVVINHEAAVPRAMVRSLVDELRQLERAAEGHFSVREAEILSKLQVGHSTAEIAKSLMISPVTVRRHISKLVHKAGVRDRDELVNAS